MEDRLKKKKVKHFIYNLLGYLLGVIIYDLLGNENSTLRVLSGILFVIVVRALLDLYEYRKHPKMWEKEKQLEKDERLIIIRDKAAYFTYNITLTILVILWFVNIIKQNDELSYLISGLIAVFIILMELSKLYWSRKM